jgi:hypothetical protein
MGIGVLKIGDGEQGALFFKHGDDDRVGGPDLLSLKGRECGVGPRGGIDVEMAGGIDAAGLVKVVSLAGVEVVGAVGGSGVDCSGALIGSDVGGENAEDGALEEGVFEGGVFERASSVAGPSLLAAMTAGASSAATM